LSICAVCVLDQSHSTLGVITLKGCEVRYGPGELTVTILAAIIQGFRLGRFSM
jgi:hypothetical protein